jgi:glycosyltransferase involved in cell wall biosynthesis
MQNQRAAGQEKPVKISVIVPAYNASRTIGRLLSALEGQQCPFTFETIVVDDGSTDDTPRIVASHPQVRYVRQDNAGPAAARNHGARLATTGYLCFTDSDCVPRQDWLVRLMDGFNGTGGAPDATIGAVMGSYGIANPESLLSRGIHEEILFRHGKLLPDFPKVFGSYNFCAKKTIFDAVGGFRETYRQASGEDNDLSYRFTRAGYRIYFKRNAIVDHYHTTDFKKYLREQWRHGFWRVAMYATHPQMVKGDDYTFWKDILEVGCCAVGLLGLLLAALQVIPFWPVIYFVLFPMLLLEIFFSCVMLPLKLEGIWFAAVLFLRAFARSLGLSTGILRFLQKKIVKNF